MANDEDVARLRQGVAVWNAWRAQNRRYSVDLAWANLSDTDLRGALLTEADLHGTNLRKADLRGALLIEADLRGANLAEAVLDGAHLGKANLGEYYGTIGEYHDSINSPVSLTKAERGLALCSPVNLTKANLHEAALMKANLRGALLIEADLSYADLSGANLSGAILQFATLISTNFTHADLTGCHVYGVSAWDLELDGAKQLDLVITMFNQPEITVDDIDLGQFIYLLLHNEKIRSVIDTITSKVVLILGRFTPERKAVLDALREELRKHDYLPVLFDFDKPVSKDLTGTVSTLANMARFIIADLTDPSSIPHELATVIPNTVVPVQPIVLAGKSEYAMFVDFRKRYSWVLATHHYTSPEHLIADLGERVVGPAEAKVRELRGLTPG